MIVVTAVFDEWTIIDTKFDRLAASLTSITVADSNYTERSWIRLKRLKDLVRFIM